MTVLTKVDACGEIEYEVDILELFDFNATESHTFTVNDRAGVNWEVKASRFDAEDCYNISPNQHYCQEWGQWFAVISRDGAFSEPVGPYKSFQELKDDLEYELVEEPK